MTTANARLVVAIEAEPGIDRCDLVQANVEVDVPAAQLEDLGTQTVEGVSAVGTRTTFTIPAGQIGNERAIEIIDERWFSPDLQTTVMTRHSDPRSGETVFRLTSINRPEPEHSLFEVPVGYVVTEQEPTRFRFDRPAKPDQEW